MKSDRSCWVGFAADVGLGVGCWVGFATHVGWVWAWVVGLGLPPAWGEFGRGLLGWVWEGMGSAREDGYG